MYSFIETFKQPKKLYYKILDFVKNEKKKTQKTKTALGRESYRASLCILSPQNTAFLGLHWTTAALIPKSC